MRRIKDIMDVKQDVLENILEVKVFNNNILLVDRYSGEAVKIGEIKDDRK